VKSNTPFAGKFTVVTGGSKGIGRAVAQKIYSMGSDVLIVARGKEALAEATQEIKTFSSVGDQFIESISADCTDMETLKPLFEDFFDSLGVPDYLINCAGYAYPEYVQNMALQDFKKQMDINYYSQLVPILIALPYFIERRSGYIVTTSSMLGFFGFIGYSCYTPTKFAIYGLTDTLRHELKPYNIKFSVIMPPDTKTPGFDIENRTKPQECVIVSEAAKVMEAWEVADEVVAGILNELFMIMPGDTKKLWRQFLENPDTFRDELDNDLKSARKKLKKE
jgi:3-dehydrosphinganine reductase